MNITAKEWFTLVAMIERIQHNQEVTGGLVQLLISKLVEHRTFPANEANELQEAINELLALSEQNQIANQEPSKVGEDRLPNSVEAQLRDLGVISEQENFTDTLDTDFGSMIADAIFKLKKEMEEGG